MDDDFDAVLAQVDILTSTALKDQSDVKTALPDEKSNTASFDEKNKTGISKSHCILVNQKQRGNPLLKSITNVPWEFEDIVPDYEISKSICALFISLRYYNMNPDYINDRLKELGKKYELRILLVQVDLKEPHIPLKNLTRICLLADLTLMLAWSAEEAGRILENYKIYENKPPDRIMEKIENDPHQKIVNVLSFVKPVNKTDAVTLLSTFGTLEKIIKSTEGQLAHCPGFATKKAQKLHKVLHQPFLRRDNLPTKFDEFEMEFEDKSDSAEATETCTEEKPMDPQCNQNEEKLAQV